MLRIALFLMISVGLTLGAATADTILVPAGSTWKYLDDGSDQGVAWRDSGFADTGWASELAQLGYGDGDEATTVSYGPDPNNKYVTTYFRHSFDVADPDQFVILDLRLLRDDGAIVYLNGVEVERSNMPSTGVGYLSFAPGTVAGTDETTFFQSYIYPTGIVAGGNVLALEIHQRSLTSSDISFDLELTGLTTLPDLMRKAPYVLYADNNTRMRIHWQLILSDTCLFEWGEDTTYSRGSSEIAEYGADHQFSRTIAGLTPGEMYYYRVTAGGYEYTGSLRAAPPADAMQVKFFAYGDTRTYPADHDAVAAGIVSKYTADPDLQTMIISVGDLVNDGDIESDWDNQFFSPAYGNIQEMLGDLAYQACMGNHEGSGDLFRKYFPYPFESDRYWSFDYGPAHFVVVDQYVSYTTGSAQLTWIENDLATTAKPWKFIYLHEPGWGGGTHSNNTTVQSYIQPLCELYDVYMVFAGHNHNYVRALVNGVHHVTTGGGGAPLYSPNLTWPNVVTGTKAHHFCMIEIDGGELHFSVITAQDSLIDSLTIALPDAGIPDREDAVTDRAFDLGAAAPNPFHQHTEIELSLSRESDVRVAIYDVDGRVVRNLIDSRLGPGKYLVEWDGMDDVGFAAPPGIYFCRVEGARNVDVGKLVLLK